jgi:hypothetical protein
VSFFFSFPFSVFIFPVLYFLFEFNFYLQVFVIILIQSGSSILTKVPVFYLDKYFILRILHTFGLIQNIN